MENDLARNNGFTNNRITNWKKSIRIGTWNVQSLYRPGHARTVLNEMKKYKLDVLGLQEVRWTENGEYKQDKYSILYSGRQDGIHRQGVGLCLSEKARKSLLSFQPINERLLKVRLNCKWFNLSVVIAYAPINDSDEHDKDVFYEQLQEVMESTSKHDTVIILGDMNAKVGRETEAFAPAIGKQSKHQKSNENGLRLASFACLNNLVIGGTIFPQKDIHKETWTSPDGKTKNQIDHIIINRKFRNAFKNVRSFRGADCSSDHFLVISEVRVRLKADKTIRTRAVREQKFDVKKLSEHQTRLEYQCAIKNRFLALETLDDEDEENLNAENKWTEIEMIIKEVAEQTLGLVERKSTKDWFDEDCTRAIAERKTAKNNLLANETNPQLREVLKSKTTEAKRIIRRKKRQKMHEDLDGIEQAFLEGKVRIAYQEVKKLRKGYQARTNMIKNKRGDTLTNEKEVKERWKEYFNELLNRSEPENPLNTDSNILHDNLTDMEPEPEPTEEEVKKAIGSVRNNKAPGSDNVSIELIKYGGNQLAKEIKRLVISMWRSEQIPSSWTEGVIIPIHKKNDRLECFNYRGITLLQTGYKVFSRILYNRLKSYTEEIIGDYQCGFRHNRSTIDHIFTLKQLMEKYWEFNKDQFHLFVDFKQAYDSIHRPSLWHILKEFNIPIKLINLTKMCLKETKSVVRIDGSCTEPFNIASGLRQGCILSCLLFNLVMEKVTRTINDREEGCKLNDINIMNLTYADDVDIIAESREDLTRLCIPIQEEASRVGLAINFEKTKFLYMSRSNTDRNMTNIMIDNKKIEEVESFKYLGATVTNLNMMEKEITVRIASANKSYYSLMPLMKRKSITRYTKIRLYNTVIRPVVLYACETWSLTKKQQQRILVFENNILRRITGPIFDEGEQRWRRRHNAEIRATTKQESIVDVMNRFKMRWAGHIARMDEHRIPKKVMLGQVTGRRPKGRPRKRWADGLKKDLQERGIDQEVWMETAQDRNVWRSLLLADKNQDMVQDPVE